jgi:hypothetical protein
VSPVERSLLFREVNDRIYELLESSDPDLPGEFLCECGSDCGHRVELLPAAFATLRATEDGVVRSPECGPRLRWPGRRAPLEGGVPALG